MFKISFITFLYILHLQFALKILLRSECAAHLYFHLIHKRFINLPIICASVISALDKIQRARNMKFLTWTSAIQHSCAVVQSSSAYVQLIYKWYTIPLIVYAYIVTRNLPHLLFFLGYFASLLIRRSIMDKVPTNWPITLREMENKTN